MKLFKDKKTAIALSLFLLTTIIFGIYYYNFIGKPLEKIFLNSIFGLSLILIVFLILLFKKTIKERWKEILLLSLFMFLLEIIFVIENKIVVTYLFFISTSFFIYYINLMSLFLKNKLKDIYFGFLFFFIPIYLIIQDIYCFIFNDFLSVAEIVVIKEGAEFASGVIHFKFIYLLYLFLGILSFIIYLKIKQKKAIQIKGINFIILFLLYFLVQFNAQYPVKEARLYTSDHYLYQTVYNHQRFISRYGINQYLFRDLTKSIGGLFKSKNQYRSEIIKYFNDHPKEHETNAYTEIFKDKNLIFIMSESFDSLAVNEELTPYIFNLMKTGLNFTNYHVPVYPRTTCDTEIIYNTGIIPSINDGPTCYTYNRNSYYHSLANLFNNKEYLTKAFHSNDKEFYTRNLVYEGLGYQEFYGQTELNLSNIEKRYDEIFYEKAKEKITKGDKFLSYIITLSGHSPYNETHLAVQKHYEKVDAYFKSINEAPPEEIKSYIASQIELDLFVKALMEDLETKDLIDNTVIIITTDHYPYTINKNTYKKYTGFTENYEKSNAPLVIWSKDIQPQEIDLVFQSFDLLPTLINLFGLEADYRYYLGNDIFSKHYEPLVLYKDYSWYDGNNYVSFGKKIKGSGSNKYINKMQSKVDNYYKISEKILRNNFFKNN